jgi:DNA (cytosine-5)-methyltransferase 1
MSDGVLTRSVLLPGARERALVLGDDYERSGGLWLPPSVVEPPELPRTSDLPIAVGLFSGAGGMDLGFTQAGFHVAAASEGWATAACTYLVNLGGPDTVVHCIGETLPEGKKAEVAWHAAHRDTPVLADEFLAACKCEMAAGSGWIATHRAEGLTEADGGDFWALPCEHFYLGDLCALTGAQILEDLGRTGDEIGCVQGGPPCQGFSRAGKRQADDPRNELVFEFMRVVVEIKPQAFCMENVPGMLDMVTRDGVPVIDALALMAEDGGMGTFEALRRSLAETAGVGAALRTKTATGRKLPPGISGAGHFEKNAPEPVEDDQLSMAIG